MLDLLVNGQRYEVAAPATRSLASVLRDDLGLTGTKVACGEGHCGACTVQLDGTPVLSCITLAGTVGGRAVTTIEGLHDHPLLEAFVRADALQCGFCTPGFLMTLVMFTRDHPNASDAEIREALAGNLCRCTGYQNIVEAVRDVLGRDAAPAGGAAHD
jgi:aerobic-type carbon monoxide dehydrogenase small subunit (CoxS/CutS family)